MTRLAVSHDLTLGGRWTDLWIDGRQWLWHRADPARSNVRPGDEFVDAGGVEECFPTVRGHPDHGDVWSRAWRSDGSTTASVRTGAFDLSRRFETSDSGVTVHYSVRGRPGARFVWAGHALLDLSTQARVDLPDGAEVRLYQDPGPFVTTQWPECDGTPMSTLGHVDGTATGAVVVDQAAVTVHDEGDELTMTLEADDDLPFSIALWRNLGGFPKRDPYRSIGVEPMVGRVFDLAESVEERDAMTVPAGGKVEWRLTLTGRCDPSTSLHLSR